MIGFGKACFSCNIPVVLYIPLARTYDEMKMIPQQKESAFHNSICYDWGVIALP